jgi:hypothetical protein
MPPRPDEYLRELAMVLQWAGRCEEAHCVEALAAWCRDHEFTNREQVVTWLQSDGHMARLMKGGGK